jgi:hypothetical protein
MRQHVESVENSAFRKALSNMQYKMRTPANITFLRSHVLSNLPGKASINDDHF